MDTPKNAVYDILTVGAGGSKVCGGLLVPDSVTVLTGCCSAGCRAPRTLRLKFYIILISD